MPRVLPETCRKGHNSWLIYKDGQRQCRSCKSIRRAQLRKLRKDEPAPPRGPMYGMIANDQLRGMVQGEMRRNPGLTLGEIALRMDPPWRLPGKVDQGDERRLTRMLGMRPTYCNKRKVHVSQRTLSEENAVMIARAINVDPWEIGV